jgi:hypothetical protein
LAVPTAAGDFLHGAAGLAGFDAGTKPSDGLQDLLTRAGLPEPENGLERAIGAGASGMAGIPGMAIPAQAVSKTAAAPLLANAEQQTAAAAVGGTLGTAVGDKVAEETESPLAGTIAALATGMVGGTVGARGVRALDKTQPPPLTLKQIKARAQNQYQSMEQEGVTLRPLSVQNALVNAEKALKDENFNPLMENHRPVQQVIDQMKTMAGTQRVPFTTLEQMRSAAVALKNDNNEATRKYAGALVEELDNYIANLNGRDLFPGSGGIDKAVKAVTEARKDWRNLSRASVLEDILNSAENASSDPTVSKQQLIRTKLRSLVADKRKMRVFSTEEQNAIKSVVNGGAADALMTLVARFNPQRSQLMLGGQVVAGTQAPVASAVSAASGFAADKLLGVKRTSELNRLISDIGNGNVRPRAPVYGWRGMLSNQPITEEDLQVIKGLQ